MTVPVDSVETVFETVNESRLPGASRPTEARPKLVVLSGPQLGRSYRLSTDPVVVGRSSGAAFQIAHRALSRQHAVLSPLAGGDWQIEDLGSRNGTRVNGIELRAPHLLRRNDRIELGPHIVLQFAVEDELDAELVRAQKLEAVGRLSASVNHDINNLLSILTANLAYLEDLEPGTPIDCEEAGVCVREMKVAVARATDLTGRLAGLVQGRGDASERIDISQLCDEVVGLMSRIVPRNIRIEHAIEPSMVVHGSRSRLHPLILNPCINARDAMPDGGTMRVVVRGAQSHELDGACPATGSYVLISIQDSGVGMDEQTAQQVFDPFFTTKGSGGTGLGLAMVAQAAREHGGTVSIRTGLHEGSELRILLPAAPPASRDAAEVSSTPAAGVSPSSARILLVDDDELVARATARQLSRSGHTIDFAGNGVEALRALRESQPDVLVLDIDMPLMDGITCFRHLREIHDEVKVVFMSGQWSSRLDEDLRRMGGVALVPKPIDMPRLMRVIDGTMQSAAPPA